MSRPSKHAEDDPGHKEPSAPRSANTPRPAPTANVSTVQPLWRLIVTCCAAGRGLAVAEHHVGGASPVTQRHGSPWMVLQRRVQQHLGHDGHADPAHERCPTGRDGGGHDAAAVDRRLDRQRGDLPKRRSAHRRPARSLGSPVPPRPDPRRSSQSPRTHRRSRFRPCPTWEKQ